MAVQQHDVLTVGADFAARRPVPDLVVEKGFFAAAEADVIFRIDRNSA